MFLIYNPSLLSLEQATDHILKQVQFSNLTSNQRAIHTQDSKGSKKLLMIGWKNYISIIFFILSSQASCMQTNYYSINNPWYIFCSLS